MIRDQWKRCKHGFGVACQVESLTEGDIRFKFRIYVAIHVVFSRFRLAVGQKEKKTQRILLEMIPHWFPLSLIVFVKQCTG